MSNIPRIQPVFAPKHVAITVRVALLVGAILQCFSTIQAKNADLSASITNLSESPAGTEPGQADGSPEIVAEGDNVHVFWFAAHANGGRKICHRRSPDRGRTWLPTYEFYQQDLAMRDPIASPLDKHLAVINGTVHIAFGAYAGEGGGWFGKMIYLRSLDNGATFEEPRVMWASVGPWHALDVRVAAADGKLAICYRQSPNWYNSLQTHVLVSSDSGATFTDTVAVTGGEGGTWSLDDFVFTGDMAAVVCMQWASTPWGWKGELSVAVSDDGGATFRQQLISVPSTNDLHRTNLSHDHHYSPIVACDSGRTHALWLGLDAAGTQSVFYRRSPDGGRTWDAVVNLTAGTSINPAQLHSQQTIEADGDLVFALIHTVAARLYLRRSTNGGETFGPLIEVTDPAGESIAADGWWPVMKRVPTGQPGVRALDIVTTGLRRFRSLDDGSTFTTTAVGPIWSLRRTDRPQFANDAYGNTHIVCEGVWTWYSTGVFGDSDVLYARIDSEPAAASGKRALQMTTQRNPGDGTGTERWDGMLIPDGGALLPRSALTIECWVKSQLTNPNVESYYVQKQGPGAAGAWETVLVGNWRSGQADVRLATDSGGYVLVGGESIVNGGWHHIAVAYDSLQAGENMRLFVDGQQVAAAMGVGGLKPGRGPIFLGGDSDRRAEGVVTIDDLRIWNRALSGDEIRARKDQALSGNEAGLVAWYPLDGSTADASGHRHHGTLLYKESFVAGVTGSPVLSVPVITSATILNGEVGVPLAYRISASTEVNAFSATGLPHDLAIDAGTGVISGTPATAGIASVPITATGSGGSANLTLTLNIRGGEVGIFDNNNIAGVQSGPPQLTAFTLSAPTLITYVMNYHYFNHGTLPGTIALRHSDGTLYGPWQSEGRIGQSGVSNAYWEVWPMVSLPVGTYTVVDSSPTTWSWNTQSQSSGISTIRGIPHGSDGAALFAAWAAANGLTGSAAEAEADPDGDGRANWIEAALGANPLRFDPEPLGVTAATVGLEHAVSYTISAGGIGVPGVDHVVNGAHVYLKASTSLISDSWSSSVEILDIAAAERINNGDGTETVVIPLRQGQLIGAPLFIREHFSRLRN